MGERRVGRAYQELLDASREVTSQTWPLSRIFVNALSIACLHAEVGDWGRATVELGHAMELAPAGARRRVSELRALALGAAEARTSMYASRRRSSSAPWASASSAPWRREA